MARSLLDHNGDVLREIITHESEEGKIHIRTAQDMEPVLDLVSTLRDVHKTVGHRRAQLMTPVAEIPLQVVERAHREGWLHDKKKWRQWINDPQNKPLRITEGRF